MQVDVLRSYFPPTVRMKFVEEAHVPEKYGGPGDGVPGKSLKNMPRYEFVGTTFSEIVYSYVHFYVHFNVH